MNIFNICDRMSSIKRQMLLSKRPIPLWCSYEKTIDHMKNSQPALYCTILEAQYISLTDDTIRLLFILSANQLVQSVWYLPLYCWNQAQLNLICCLNKKKKKFSVISVLYWLVCLDVILFLTTYNGTISAFVLKKLFLETTKDYKSKLHQIEHFI